MAPSAITFKNAKIEISTNAGSAYTDFSGAFSEVKVTGGDRKEGQIYDFSDDVAVLGQGKREPRTVEMTVIYTETTTDPFLTLLPYHVAGSSIAVRITPKGTATGVGTVYQYTSSTSGNVFKTLELPNGTAEKGDPTVVKAVIITPTFTTSTTTA